MIFPVLDYIKSYFLIFHSKKRRLLLLIHILNPHGNNVQNMKSLHKLRYYIPNISIFYLI
jgi:hypothetical protein